MEKNDPTKTFTVNLKTASTVIGGIVAILGSIWALDSHYASAADVQQMQRGIELQVRQIRQERVEDELFKLDIKKQQQGGRLDPIEQALYERYARRLMETKAAEDKAAETSSAPSRGIMSFIK